MYEYTNTCGVVDRGEMACQGIHSGARYLTEYIPALSTRYGWLDSYARLQRRPWFGRSPTAFLSLLSTEWHDTDLIPLSNVRLRTGQIFAPSLSHDGCVKRTCASTFCIRPYIHVGAILHLRYPCSVQNAVACGARKHSTPSMGMSMSLQQKLPTWPEAARVPAMQIFTRSLEEMEANTSCKAEVIISHVAHVQTCKNVVFRILSRIVLA